MSEPVPPSLVAAKAIHALMPTREFPDLTTQYDITIREAYCEVIDEVEKVKAERDKLVNYYNEIVREIGHDCVLRELREVRAELAALHAERKATGSKRMFYGPPDMQVHIGPTPDETKP